MKSLFVSALFVILLSVVGLQAYAAEQKTVEATTSTVIEKFGDKALQYVNALEELTKQYAPDVVDSALLVVRISGIRELLPAIIWFILFPLLFMWAIWFCNQKPKSTDYGTRWHYYEPGPQIGVASFAAMGGLLWVISACIFLDVWNWVRIFEPKLWIAYKILGKLF